ncbi:protein DEFECTIVE IN MERISTEM SILENCING 3 isoform X1 [Nicotiana tabacum]|uniref:Protein DEFECTIVE IN MERISTEM SILENCING 3 isoform X1 n=1 Tax=Nicotiana tabacum TaxID=4097 RepID=A0A1S3Z914_TOBAC|nr:PREDICTED: protein DEFECTIVE IN MERISTEM SILENCING 3-like isoform X1 [Nicotiana tabacum]
MTGDQRRMSIDGENVQLSISPKALAVHDPSKFNQGGQINSSVFAGDRDTMQNGAAEAVICNSKKLQDAMQEIGLKIKHHEDNIKFLKAQKNILDDSILDTQVALGRYQSASEPGSQNNESSNRRNEEEIIEQILKHDKSAAGIYCQLKTHHGPQVTHLPLLKDVIGIVALLGKVDDDNLSRLLSDYLGLETMLAVVCKTPDGIKALETYDKEGFINKSSGLYALGASIGRALDARFVVICLGNLRPYEGAFIADDPQRRLALMKPRLPNGETPPGFLGFAVNMINIDSANLYCATSTGHGLRETLFYKLFSRLQVYKTRTEMLQALTVITHGAISLDGGIIKSNGVFALGYSEVEVKFPKSSGRSNLPENYFDTESRLKELKWKRDRFLEDLHREQTLLDHAKFNFEIKKQEFVKFLAHSSSFATPQKFPAGGEQSTPIS